MRVRFTKKFVEDLVADDRETARAENRKLRDVVAWDSEVPGFGVKVTPSGLRTYFVYYRTKSGQQRRPKIGNHGSFTVQQARDIARQWLAAAAIGTDVSGDRQELRSAPTVSDLAIRYLREYAEPYKKPRSIQSDRSNLENHVLPILGEMIAAVVKRSDVERLKSAVRDGTTARELPAKPRGRRKIRGGEGAANRVLALVSKMFACAIEWGLRDDNPATGVRKYLEHRKDRFLDENEIRELLKQLHLAQVSSTLPINGIAAIKILLFTGMRYSEVMTLRWRDVDDTNRFFRLSDSKTGARVIPYGEATADALGTIERTSPDRYVFEGTKPDAPLSLRRPWYIVRDMAGLDSTVTLHTLRHTFASWSVMSGLSLAQVGAQLGHRSPQTTLRYADHATDALRSYNEKTSAAIAAFGTN